LLGGLPAGNALSLQPALWCLTNIYLADGEPLVSVGVRLAQSRSPQGGTSDHMPMCTRNAGSCQCNARHFCRQTPDGSTRGEDSHVSPFLSRCGNATSRQRNISVQATHRANVRLASNCNQPLIRQHRTFVLSTSPCRCKTLLKRTFEKWRNKPSSRNWPEVCGVGAAFSLT
jgi:hypothetical protein